MKIVSIILQEWTILTNGSLPGSHHNIVKMHLAGEDAIRPLAENDLSSKPALDGLSYSGYLISVFNSRPNALPIFRYCEMDNEKNLG